MKTLTRTTVTLESDVYEAAVHLSRSSGTRIGKVLSELLRRGLSSPMPLSAAERVKGRFPVFAIPAGSPIIPASRIQKALEDEDF